MKILYVITKANFGGAQRYVYELATDMYASGHTVTVAFGEKGALHDMLAEARIRTISIPSLQRDISIFKELKVARDLWRLYRDECPDVVHLNSSKAGGIGALVARLRGIPRIVYTAHGWAFWEQHRSFIWRALAWIASWVTVLLSHRVIVVSKHDACHAQMPFCAHKFEIIHTAVPAIAGLSRTDARNALFSSEDCALHKNDHWLTTTAELTQNKNLFVAIDAVTSFNASHDQKIFYCIMGEGELHGALTEHIQKKGVQSHVTLLGYVADARIYLKAFDIFLLSSKKEGLPYALLEAGVAGLPTIASRVGGIPEVITDGENGLLINPFDTTTITQALATLTHSAADSETLGARLQQTVTKNFSLNRMLSATEALYVRMD